MATRARDSHADSTSRDKENDPIHGRGSRRQFIPSLVKSPEKQDFFTDTVLDDSDASQPSQHSLIPLPKSTRDRLSHPRKKIQSINPPRAKHRATRSELPPQNAHSKSLARGTSPDGGTGLSTPPSSRDGSTVDSPLGTFSSPPRALTETYERIGQEEDLVANEDDLSDLEDDGPDKEKESRLNGYRSAKQRSAESIRQTTRSGGSTPTNQPPVDKRPPKREDDLTTASILSDPTGMSFVRDLSDRNLQIALTPLVLESAKDRKALEQAWSSKKPIAFGKARRMANDNIDVPDAVPSSPNLPPRRLIPFSKAGRIKLASDLVTRPQHQRTISDMTQQSAHNPQSRDRPANNDNWHDGDFPRDIMPHNPRLQRQNFFPQNHGFPVRKSSNDDEPHLTSSRQNELRKARSESPVISTSQPPPLEQSRQNASMRQLDLRTSFLPTSAHRPVDPEADLTMENDRQSQATSEFDWMQAAAEEPVPTIEHEVGVEANNQIADTQEVLTSPEKSKRFDFDFTGQSFQVSESPPVRGKNMTKDYHRDREIEGVAKQAVATSRLSQLRARESQERLRATSRSPVSEPAESDRYREPPLRSNSLSAERILDTPVVIYKASSTGHTGRRSSTPTVRPSPDRSRSHEVLQRLARGSSSTPRSSTPSERTINGEILDTEEGREYAGQDSAQTDWVPNRQAPSKPEPASKPVQQTPKVVGAWTDTILPDTVKTTKRNGQVMRYNQTPHVSAGGWIDTPAPNGQSVKLEPVLEVTQEVPEELMDGIVTDKASASNNDKTEVAAPGTSVTQAPVIIPPAASESLAKKVLNEAKEKLKAHEQTNGQGPSQIVTSDSPNDTLALGNATIQSLENILDMDQTDITILSRLGDEPLGQTEEEVLDRLGSRLDRLRRSIHDARKGISNLEHRISQPQPGEEALQLPVTTETYVESTVDGQNAPPSTAATRKQDHEQIITASRSIFPLALLKFAVPVPLLFRPPSKNATGIRSRLPQPTLFGWAVLTFWTWYILECTLCEIYSHPQYAAKYTWPLLREPEFPFVLPTMLYRWSHLNFLWPSMVQPVYRFIVGLFRMIGIWLGVTDGFVDGPAGATGTATVMETVMETVYQQAHATGVDIGVDMMNDEFL
ncbi:hypothetical protein H2198_003250 [Neophaeococcomyces mojaviensis]|uniref:Uncharacterized protein n=1 Tax=Neophaeococcomyces mojaviensis TaxID=3383035 RepID=A0ACC3ABW5_9EURO|nr:hypothetical protein H2198_003250 [Knufia sp. JES_112]